MTPPPIKAASPKPPVKTTRTRTRVGMKTYKINKTIAKSSTPKPVTSKAAVDAAKTIAFEEALVQLESEAERSPDTDAPLSGMVIDRLIMAGVGLPADIFVGA